tara:strand:+ start:16 stop:1110 length:1095 start_codon:yes stop_codon:yes gene_type:complete
MDKIEQFIDLFAEVWKSGISGINISEIIIALSIFFIFLLLRGFFAKFVIKRLEKYVSKTTNRFDNSLVESLKGPTKFFPIVIGFFIATSYVSLGEGTENFVDNANRTLITILIFWSIHQLIGPLSVLIKSVGDLLSRDLLNWIIKAIKILILILGAAAVLELWGIKIGPIIAGLGLFGVAVALGAQDLFKNLISGILVLVERRFRVGDWIYVEGVIEGSVENIGFRSTVVRRFDKSLATIPNFQFAEKAVINNSQITHRKIDWLIGLEYKTTVDQLTKIRDQIEDYIKKSKDFSKDKETFMSIKIDQFAASSIDIRVLCYTSTKHYIEWLEIKDRLVIEIKKIVEKNGSSFAFPSQSIYVEKNQ